MRRLTASLLALTALSILTTPVLAQSPRTSPGARQPTAEELEKKRDAAEIENRYKATIKATPAKSATNNDPWALVRGTDGKPPQR